MAATLNAAGATLLLLASLTACCCKGVQEESLLVKVEQADTDNGTTAGIAGVVTTPEPRNDTRTEVTSQANSLQDGGASSAKTSSSGWDTVYKLLYETFSYPEAKELEALLPLPSTYLTRKQRRDRKGDHDEDRKKEEEERQHATRELTYRTVSSGDGSGDRSSDRKEDAAAYDEGGDPGSSESSSQSEDEEDDVEGRKSGDPLDDDDDDDAESGDDDDVVKQKTSSTPTPSSSKAHRRTERSVPTTGTILPAPRPWKEHGKDFGLPVPEDRWSKHVAAKRREAQLIRRSLQNQLRMKALQWRQKENHFHQRYKPAIPSGTV